MRVLKNISWAWMSLISASVVFIAAPLTSCRSADEIAQPERGAAGPGLYAPLSVLDQDEVLRAQERRLIKVEVTVEAPVYKILDDDREGLPHQRFLIALRNGTTILIAHDLKMAPRVPIAPGDIVRVHGEYIWNKKGGVIHWTHQSRRAGHENGWIELNGRRFQ